MPRPFAASDHRVTALSGDRFFPGLPHGLNGMGDPFDGADPNLSGV